MDMVSDSGAITDVNEIAAALGLAPEDIRKEDEAVMASSLEDLLESIGQIEASVNGDDIGLYELSPAMESVINVVKGIQASGAISRSDALTLRQMTASLEDFQDVFSNMPINSFTETPSKVNFDASMEGILDDIGRKIVEVIKAIIKWIRDKSKQLIGFIRNGRIVAQQANLAAAKVSKEHKNVTADTLRTAIEKEIAAPTQTPQPIVKNAIAQLDSAKADDSSKPPVAIADVINVTRDEISRAIPDLYILFYSEKILEKSATACTDIIDCCMNALKDNDPVRFFNRIEDIFGKVPGGELNGSLDVRPFGQPGGAARMASNSRIINGSLTSSQIFISKLHRSFELIKNIDEFECVNKIAAELKNHSKVATDLSPKIMSALRFNEDQLKQAERIISSTSDQEVLANTQEKATFIQMINSMIMYVHGRQGDNIIYIGKMAKFVNGYKL